MSSRSDPTRPRESSRSSRSDPSRPRETSSRRESSRDREGRRSSSRSREGGSSSRSRGESSSGGGGGTSSKRDAAPFPSVVKIVDSNTAFGTTKTEAYWVKPEFDDLTAIKNVNEKTCPGVILPAGTMFPLGAAIPVNTVLLYGAYFPAGTMFPDGALIPIHSRVVSCIPLPTEKNPKKDEPVCVVM